MAAEDIQHVLTVFEGIAGRDPDRAVQYIASMPSEERQNVREEVGLPPPLKTSIPSIEMSKLLVAEAIPGVAATAAPIPRPAASMPSRPIPRAFFIGLPFPDRATGGHRSQRRRQCFKGGLLATECVQCGRSGLRGLRGFSLYLRVA